MLWTSAKQYLTQWKVLQSTYDGPWNVTPEINPTTYEVANEQGEITKIYSQKATAPYSPSM
jgi:hypothetical protein